jgi:primosomal protein N' (replication factor Y)
MYIIEVIPLIILPPNAPQILSYFFTKKLERGAVVEITINHRKIKAVVISSKPIETEKLSLKKADFQIKKINKVIYEKPQISAYQFKLAEWLSKYYYAPLGYTIKSILPPFSFKKNYSSLVDNFDTNSITPSDGVMSKLVIYKTKKLINHLEKLVIDYFKNDQQILILVPEKISINYFFNHFSKKYNTTKIYSELSNKEFYNACQKIKLGQTKIIIGTRQALNIHYNNLKIIIIDDPLNDFYKSDMTPKYNAVKFAEKVAELNKAKIIFASVFPGVDNYYRQLLKKIDYEELESRPNFNFEIIDMTQESKNTKWSAISKKLNEEIISYLKNNKKVLIFSPRRGYIGIIVCKNCGAAVKCSQCEIAMRTHRSTEIILICHHCGVSKPIPKKCSLCGSYELKTVGPSGTQKIFDEIRTKLFTDKIKNVTLVLDSDTAKNETEEEEIISEISKSKSAILIATQSIFSYRFYCNFDLVCIINADSLINMPDFRSEENFFYQIEKLISFEPDKLIIQTYNPESKLLEQAINGNYSEFYKNEIKFREALNYPPFFKFIKLTFRHKNKDKAFYTAKITTEKLKIIINKYNLNDQVKIIEAAPAYIEKEKGLYFYNIFLKIKEDYHNYRELLKYISPEWLIDVEPRSIL